jgi:DNA-binding IclR family transcriptional regulator
LRDTLDESVLLAKVSGLQATYLLAFEPTHPLRFLVKVGDPIRSLHATSAGKSLLGGLDDAALDAFLRTANLKPHTDRTINGKAALRQEVLRGRARGWHLNQGESLEGVTTLAASFRWNAAQYIVIIAAPSSRIDPRLDEAAGLLTNVCLMLQTHPGRESAA